MQFLCRPLCRPSPHLGMSSGLSPELQNSNHCAVDVSLRPRTQALAAVYSRILLDMVLRSLPVPYPSQSA